MFLQKINRFVCNIKATNNYNYLYKNVTTVQNILERWTKVFDQEKVPESENSIENIVAHVLDTKCLEDVKRKRDHVLSETQLNKIDQLCNCRLARIPVQYIIGEWNFKDLTLSMVPPVFIPRPETEELVNLILQQIDITDEINFLEIGCGSGAISLALLKSLPKAKSFAIDQSQMACDLTLKNAKSVQLDHRIKISKHKIIDTLPPNFEPQLFSMIVSNPPYVPTKDIPELQPEIKIYEDLRALDGGVDGLKVITGIISLASKHLIKEGSLWLECDPAHPELISQYLKDNPEYQLQFVASYKDIFHRERFVEIIKL